MLIAGAGVGLGATTPGGSGANGAARPAGGGPLPCRAWNVGICSWQPCKFSHFCNKVMQGGGFCKKTHKAKDHK